MTPDADMLQSINKKAYGSTQLSNYEVNTMTDANQPIIDINVEKAIALESQTMVRNSGADSQSVKQGLVKRQVFQATNKGK